MMGLDVNVAFQSEAKASGAIRFFSIPALRLMSCFPIAVVLATCTPKGTVHALSLSAFQSYVTVGPVPICQPFPRDRKSGVEGKRVGLGGRRTM